MLELRSCGAPKQPIVSFFATLLQEVKYYTCTAFGLSEETFGGLQDGYSQKPQGAGQGNGGSPSDLGYC